MSSFPIRPHHALCGTFFEGKGYSEEFTQNMEKTLSSLKGEQTATVVCGEDIICGCCPENFNGSCLSKGKASRIDGKVMEICGLTEGMEISVGELFSAVLEKIIFPGRLEEVCSGCCWSELCFEKAERLRDPTL